MKNYLFYLLTMLGVFSAHGTTYSQKIESEKVNDFKTVSLLNDVRDYRKFKSTDLSVKLYVVSNPSGSAGIPESDEVTDNIYIAVSEYDEHPKQSLFCLKNVYGASNFQLTKTSKNAVSLSFIYADGKIKRKAVTYITIDDVLISF